MQRHVDPTLGILLGSAALLSLASAQTVDFGSIRRSALQPYSVAFGVIWSVVYTLLGAQTVVLLSPRQSPPPVVATSVAVASLACTVGWSATAASRPRLALGAIAASAALAWPAAILSADDLVPAAAYGLLAGWLSVATTLSTASAFPRLDDTRTLLAVSASIATGAAAAAQPWPVAALAWGVALQRRFDLAVAASFAFALAGTGVATARRVAP